MPAHLNHRFTLATSLRRCAGVALLWGLSLGAAMGHELPVGDGKISTSPQVGYLMSCMQSWQDRDVHSGPWIQGSMWDPEQKPSVAGQVAWPDSQIRISLDGDSRVIEANNLPEHATGTYPIQRTDPVFQYDRNPNAIRAQNILLRLPANPQLAATPSCVPMGMIGFTLDGAAIYNAVDAVGLDAAAHEVQDSCNGHPERNGQYHYHGPSPCMPNEQTSGLVGYALDGFGIYGMRDAESGRVLHNEDLDACHGTTSEVLWDGRKVRMYHYVLTEEYPYTVGCFRGNLDSSNMNRGQVRQNQGSGDHQSMPSSGQGMAPANHPNGPAHLSSPQDRRARLEQAAQQLNISVETLRRALGPPPPDLQRAAQQLGISEQSLRDALAAPR